MRILAAIFLLLGIGAANAQTPSRITPDTANITCVGKADTPQCATATFFACAVRRTAEICAAAGLTEPPRLFDGTVAVEWLVDRASIIRERDVTEDLQHFAWFKAGNTLVEAQVRRCARSGGLFGRRLGRLADLSRPARGRRFCGCGLARR